VSFAIYAIFDPARPHPLSGSLKAFADVLAASWRPLASNVHESRRIWRGLREQIERERRN
jgi:hypothetical protein